MKPAKIPDYLGKCNILKTHDDGDLTIECSGVKYVVTTEGDVFKEYDATQCFIDGMELEQQSEEWQGLSLQQKRDRFLRAAKECINFKKE